MPSRRRALDSLTRALVSGGGPVLLTGEPGVGKSWLCRWLRRRTPASWRWLSIDLSSHLGVHGVYRLILRGLGRSFPSTLDVADARIALEEALIESTLDGTHWGLILDEGHNGEDSVLEEIRVLSNRLGAPEGLAGIVLAGQPGILRRLAQRPLSALASRLVDRVHLRPFGLNEMVEFVRQREPGVSRDPLELERLHREIDGNPRLLCLWNPEPSRPSATRAGNPARPSPVVIPPMVPVRPPLRVGEGMVEVGWETPAGPEDPDDQEGWEAAASTTPERRPESSGDLSEHRVDPPVEDYDEALRAWSVWTRHPSRPDSIVPDPTIRSGPAQETDGTFSAEVDEEEEEMEPTSDGPVDPDLRVESEHGFAPYGQLFSRLKEARDPS